MIAIDLECSMGHIFEGWFDSIEAFEGQNTSGLVACPYCDDTKISRVLSAITVKKSSGEKNNVPSEHINYQRLAKEIVDYVRDNFEDVGARFASEALKIHYGVGERRNIRGSATQEEEETLKEEGVEFFKAPFPKVDDEDKNN